MINQNYLDNDFDYDVIIVGCGPAGSITARYIQPKKNGLRVLVIDRRKKIGVPVQCGEGIIGYLAGQETVSNTYDKKELFECPDNVKAHRIDRLQFITLKHKIIEIPVSGYTIHRDLFDQFLSCRAAKEGAIIKKRVSFLGFKDKNTIQTNSGEITGNIIVGADGPTSSVAKSCGLQAPQITAKCVLAKIKGDFYDHTLKLFYGKIFKSGYGWIFSKGDHANVGFGTEFYKPSIKNHYTLRGVLDDFIKKELSVSEDDIFFRGGGIIPTGGLLHRIYKDNVLLVGDAAGMVHPSTGAGIGYAMVAGRECGFAVQRHLLYNEELRNYERKIREILQPSFTKGLRMKKTFQLISSTDFTLELSFWFIKTVGITKFIM